jgi:hypothetical protein
MAAGPAQRRRPPAAPRVRRAVARDPRQPPWHRCRRAPRTAPPCPCRPPAPAPGWARELTARPGAARPPGAAPWWPSRAPAPAGRPRPWGSPAWAPAWRGRPTRRCRPHRLRGARWVAVGTGLRDVAAPHALHRTASAHARPTLVCAAARGRQAPGVWPGAAPLTRRGRRLQGGLARFAPAAPECLGAAVGPVSGHPGARPLHSHGAARHGRRPRGRQHSAGQRAHRQRTLLVTLRRRTGSMVGLAGLPLCCGPWLPEPQQTPEGSHARGPGSSRRS